MSIAVACSIMIQLPMLTMPYELMLINLLSLISYLLFFPMQTQLNDIVPTIGFTVEKVSMTGYEY